MNLLEPPKDDTTQTARTAAGHRPPGGADAGTAVFLTTRPRLLAIGLHVLGDHGDAEDVVQEAWLRWHRTDHTTVLSPAAFLAMTTTRLAINLTQSAHHRRETAAGPYLPDTPDPALSPESAAEHHHQTAAALHLLLERLSPAERAAYLLRHAFDYPYRHISAILGLSADHTRQLVRRAHRHLTTGHRRPVAPATHRRLLRAFVAAARTGNLAPLEALLTADLAAPTCHRPTLERTCQRRTATERAGAHPNAGLRPIAGLSAAFAASSGGRRTPSASR